MSVVQEFEPKTLWKHFDAILQIPRPSTKEQKAREYVLGIVKKAGLKHEEDKVGNIVIRKPAHKGRENAPITVLQGHLDMVCEKNEATKHDFESDAIRPVKKGEWLYADGTTLGADNGIGVSAALAVMESTDIAHGPLELIFTIDEETGLTGAAEFPPGILKSKYFLNLDNEETGTLCIGCSGGLNTTARRKVTLQAAGKGSAYRVKVSGLKGGHSGVDIHLGRANALRILGTTIQQILEKLPVALADIKGGSARNVIPREASAVIVLEGKEAELKALVEQLSNEAKTDLGLRSRGADHGGEDRCSGTGAEQGRRAGRCRFDVRNPARGDCDEPRHPRPGADVDQPGGRLAERRDGGNRDQPAKRDPEQHSCGGETGRDRVPAGGFCSGIGRRISGMETGTGERAGEEVQGRLPEDLRQRAAPDRHACRAGVRSDRR